MPTEIVQRDANTTSDTSSGFIGNLQERGTGWNIALFWNRVNDGKNTENVITQSMGYDRKSYSPLAQVNRSNVQRLVPIWNTILMNDSGELAAPTVYNGVMYVTP